MNKKIMVTGTGLTVGGAPFQEFEMDATEADILIENWLKRLSPSWAPKFGGVENCLTGMLREWHHKTESLTSVDLGRVWLNPNVLLSGYLNWCVLNTNILLPPHLMFALMERKSVPDQWIPLEGRRGPSFYINFTGVRLLNIMNGKHYHFILNCHCEISGTGKDLKFPMKGWEILIGEFAQRYVGATACIPGK